MLITCNSSNLDSKILQELNNLKSWNKHIPVYTVLNIDKNDFPNIPEIINKYGDLFDFKKLDGEILKSLSESDIIDIILDIKSLSYYIYLDNYFEFNDFFIDIKDKLGVDNLILCKNYSSSTEAKTFDLIDLEVVAEIFEIPSKAEYNVLDFMINLDMSNALPQVHSYSEGSLSLPSKKLYTLENLSFLVGLDYHNKIKLINDYPSPAFDLKIHEPVFDVNIDIEQLIEHKWGIFEVMKTLNATNMCLLPEEVVTFCNRNEFVSFKDTLEIISGEYPFIKYYKKGVES